MQFPRPVRKAVFPVAGMGTRFLPATKAMPKEMLPVVDKPLIQYAVEEAVAAIQPDRLPPLLLSAQLPALAAFMSAKPDSKQPMRPSISMTIPRQKTIFASGWW